MKKNLILSRQILKHVQVTLLVMMILASIFGLLSPVFLPEFLPNSLSRFGPTLLILFFAASLVSMEGNPMKRNVNVFLAVAAALFFWFRFEFNQQDRFRFLDGVFYILAFLFLFVSWFRLQQKGVFALKKSCSRLEGEASAD